MGLAKQPQVIDPEYLAWLRLEPCWNCGQSPSGQAHHAILKGMGRATVRDDYAIPCCKRCHMRCHGQIVEGKLPIAKSFQLEAARDHRARYLVCLALRGSGSVPF